MVLALLICSRSVTAEFSTNLPIIVINTGGKTIRNAPRIVAQMGVIDNGPKAVNRSSDPFTDYNGIIAIEIRGSSGQWQKWPKEQYGFETQNPDGSNRNVPLLGLPEENDWILYPPYSDKSLIRNVLAYRLSRDIGRYAPRTRFCELVLNGDYRGVYVLIEKIKRDKNRVNIAKLRPQDISGDQLTGGYIVKIDRRAGEENEGWTSPYRFSTKGEVEWLFHDPGPDELTTEQKAYIRGYVTAFEQAMSRADWEQTVDRFFDIDAFVDYYLLTELANNIDTYTFSTFFYKDRDSRGGRLTIGPIWDINLGFGNADYFVGMKTEGWLLGEKIRVRDRIPFWLQKLFEARWVQQRIADRWQALRRCEWSEQRMLTLIDAYVDTLQEAQQRNFARWPILGQYVWPNAFVGKTFEEEIGYLKDWLVRRGRWIDQQPAPLASCSEGSFDIAFTLGDNYPNPFHSETTISYELSQGEWVHLAIYDLLGRRTALLVDAPQPAGIHQVCWNGFTETGAGAPAGLYLYRLTLGNRSIQKRLVLVR